MTPSPHDILVAAEWAVAGGVAAWLITVPLRRRSLAYVLASVVFVGTTASVAAMVGSFRAMFISTNELALTVTVALAAGIVASLTAWMSIRRLVKDREVLHDAVHDIEEGRVPSTDGRRLSAELETLRGQLEETGRRLTESRERERAVETSRRELVAFLSHDLRTPLAGLRAMSEALEDGVADSPDLYYKQIRVEVERLTNMVNDLFDLSRIQAGSFALSTETVALDDVVSDCLAALAPLARARSVRLSGQSSGAATVSGDGHELNRAMTNLVANAIRHTRTDGAIEVTVKVSTNPPLAEVIVRDECGGIPREDLERVFEIGFRGEAARTPQHEQDVSAGFGLAITRGIVEAHRGTIEVCNVDGGCRFTVRLPTAA
ncbi:signal transduction histidine kinase [Jatrophihabitans sp. GAS493]|nr:signal transduction histidine kinase [Jatrophihabitans sp. GAS493]